MAEKAVIFVTFLSSCLAVALLAGAMGTDHWVVARATRNNTASSGRVNAGLFRGTRRLNYGFGVRVRPLDVWKTQYREQGYLVRGLYATTIVATGAGVLMGAAMACLALYNVAASPPDAACQFPGNLNANFYSRTELVDFSGLISVSLVSTAFALASVVTWLVQFFLKLRANVLPREDVLNGGWSSAGAASLGFSFWMVLVAAAVFFANSTAYLHLQRRRARRRMAKEQILDTVGSGPAAAKGGGNGNIMLY